MEALDARATFRTAALAMAEFVSEIPADRWERPALGSWDVRALVGHLGRALSTVEAYIDRPQGGAVLSGPIAYFRVALGTADPERRSELDRQIEARGRAAGVELGEDPGTSFRALAARVVALVDGASGAELCGTPFGDLPLDAYLATRSFELAVHGLDLARALDRPAPDGLDPAIRDSLLLSGQLAASSPRAGELLLLFSGRPVLGEGLSVL